MVKKAEKVAQKAKQVGINVQHEVKWVNVRDLQPAPYNPREISNEALAGLRMSLRKFGDVQFLIVNKRNMRVISGHQRLKVYIAEGVEKVQAVMVDVDEVQEMAMNLEMNNTQIMGHWTVALGKVLDKMKEQIDEEEFLGLKLRELEKEAEALGYENLGAGNKLPDDVPSIPKKAKTKRGDLWILGNHRLMCGDSTLSDDVASLMGGGTCEYYEH